MATAPVIGIDFGNDTCFIAVARAGGIEVLINDYSTRDTPSCVAFTSKNRMMGTSAKQQITTNINNTVFGFKRLLGLQFEDTLVGEEQKFLPFTLVATPEGEVGCKVWYLGEETVFSIKQVVAMLLTKLKELAESALSCKIIECVIAVPYFFTDVQRRALLDAASIADLQVLRLLNEPSAAAVAYGLYRSSGDLPNSDQPAKHVAFVDFGSSALQVAIAAFHKGKVKMLAAAFDPTLGGRSFDHAIAHQLAQSFNKPGMDVTKNKRSWIRLLAEVDKLKRQMSANTSALPINIECLMEERDFSGKMKRSEMEELCAPLLQRIEETLRRCLQDSGVKQEDITEVELIGGSTRVPAVKSLIEQVFGKAPSTTLNQDECVARGAAIMAAMLSPNFKVREFSLTDLQPFSINLKWGGDDVEQGDMEVFPRSHAVPFSKILSFYRKGPFVLTARYADQDAGRIQSKDVISQFHVNGVKPGPQGEAQKVKVKVRLNLHGVFQVVSATLMEKQPGTQASGEGTPDAAPTESETMETEPSANENQEAQAVADSHPQKMDTNETETQEGDKPAAPQPPKQIVKSVDLPIEGKTGSLTPQQLQDFTEREANFKSVDNEERARLDAKNALEEFVISIRGRVNDSDDLEPYIESNVRDELVQLADGTENWLYDEGEDCKKQEYVNKLQQLQGLANPAMTRRRDHETVPKAAEQFAATLNRFQKALLAHQSGDPIYDHWTPEEAKKLETGIAEKSAWLDSSISQVKATLKTKEVPIKAAAFISEQQAFENAMNPIVNKPKPKPPTPPAPEPQATPAPEGASNPEQPPEKMETE